MAESEIMVISPVLFQPCCLAVWYFVTVENKICGNKSTANKDKTVDSNIAQHGRYCSFSVTDGCLL